MSNCSKAIGEYVAESDLPGTDGTCNSSSAWSKELSRAWDERKKSVVAVSGGLEASGGGVILDNSLLPHLKIESNERMILTAAHLVKKKDMLLVGSYDSDGAQGNMRQAKLVAQDKEKDLALLRVSFSNEPPADGIRDHDLREAKPGEIALAVLAEDAGRSLGLFAVSDNRSYGSIGGADIRKRFPGVTMTDSTNIVVFTTADAPGTSGSPVIAADGKILGLESQRLPEMKAHKLLRDSDDNPKWQRSAAVSSTEIIGFLKHVDGTCGS